MNITRGLRKHDGSAVIVVILLLAIVMIYIGANLRSMHFLEREIKLVERRQLQRLQTQNAATNALPRP